MPNQYEAMNINREAQRTLNRLLPRIEEEFAGIISQQPQEWSRLQIRLTHQFPRLFKNLLHLYGKQYDFFILPGFN